MSIDWFLACRFTEPRLVRGERVPWPTSVAHAKQMGGITTACGHAALTMTKLWDVQFPIRGETCQACLDVVVEARRRPQQVAAPASLEGGRK